MLMRLYDTFTASTAHSVSVPVTQLDCKSYLGTLFLQRPEVLLFHSLISLVTTNYFRTKPNGLKHAFLRLNGTVLINLF